MTRRVAALAALLQTGGVLIAPTDTAYALAADARHPVAIRRVKRLKGRAATKPIALLAADQRQVEGFFQLTNAERRLAKSSWPGPLTLVLRPRRSAALAVSALSRTGRVGVRVPRLKIARDLCRAVGAPLTATSANRSGQPACYTVLAARRSLGRNLKALDVGPLPRRPVSTIVAVRHGQLVVLRTGPVRRPR